GESLKAKGYEVIYSIPASALRTHADPPPDIVKYAFTPPDAAAIINQVDPDCVVFCHWPVLAGVGESIPVPVVLDLAGPHVLERLFMQPDCLEQSAVEKIGALSRADCFICAGAVQKAYFTPWLMAAGVDVTRTPLHVAPICMPPDQPVARPSTEPRIAFSGIFLPWQDPGDLLEALVNEIEAHECARLEFFGGPHPIHPVPAGAFATLLERIRGSDRVVFHGIAPFDDLVKTISTCTAAFDVMLPNIEREIAFNVRTVMYMWCGVPVIYNNYAELARHIAEYEAGWLVNPADQSALRKVLRDLLTSPDEAARRGSNAQRLVRERFSWDTAMAPLHRFMQHPMLRDGHSASQQVGFFELRMLEFLAEHRYYTRKPVENSVESPRYSDAETRAELKRLERKVAQCESELSQTRQHARNLEEFRDRVMATSPYKFYRVMKRYLGR
ncbi:glycosyltransferase, partial [bacterium]|nr:glycosyltransferase [candidate division CSSED10-310 bacterium]